MQQLQQDADVDAGPQMMFMSPQNADGLIDPDLE